LAKGALSEPLKKLLFSDYCLKSSVKFGLVPIASIILIPFSSLKMSLIVERISISLSLSLVFVCGVLSIYYLTKFITDRYELYSNYRKMLNLELGNINNKNRNALLIELKILLVVEGKGDDKIILTNQNNIIDNINAHISRWGDREEFIKNLTNDVINAIKNNKNDHSSCLGGIYEYFEGVSRLYEKDNYKSKKIEIDKNIELLVDICCPILNLKENSRLEIDLKNNLEEIYSSIIKGLVTNFRVNPISYLFYLKLYNKHTRGQKKLLIIQVIKQVLENLSENEKIDLMPIELYNEFLNTIDESKELPPVPKNG